MTIAEETDGALIADADARLWAALDGVATRVADALSIPAPKSHHCLRCGNDWNAATLQPKCCPLCHSAYWDTAATNPRGRKPTESGLRRLKAKAKRDRRRNYLTAKARKHGIELEPLPEPTAEELLFAPAPAPQSPPMRPRTVPPPPGLEDLG
jgi:hypothetical protein